MAAPTLPLILEPAELQEHLHDTAPLIVDLADDTDYQQRHVPGAVHLPFSSLIRAEPPAMGLLPHPQQLSEVFSRLGLTAETHVVAYDHEANGRAGRLLWTLDVLGHERASLLNGGINAWEADGFASETASNMPAPSDYRARIARPELIADKDYILEHLQDPAVAVLDARSPGEYSGTDVRAARGGHIPGAVNLNWLETMDGERQRRLLPDTVLRQMLEQRGLTSDKEVIAHCQTHHRSSHSYVMLKHLGYSKLRGYPGSWSEWGNDPQTPIET